MNKVLYSASDISNFENCKCHIINKIRISKGVKIKRKETTRTEDEYKKQGKEIELNYLSKLSSYTSIDEKLSNKEKLLLTKQAISNGDDFIYQPYLLNNHFHGYPDVLKKITNGNSYSYEVIDIKRAKEPKKSHITQIHTYNFLLMQTEGYVPTNFHIVNGVNHNLNSFKIEDSFDNFLDLKNDFENYVSTLEKKTTSELEKILLEVCLFNNRKIPQCETTPPENDLINVVGLNKKQKKILFPLVKNIEGLSKFKIKKIKGISEIVQSKLVKQAIIQNKKIKDKKNYWELLPFIENKGLYKLPKKNSNDLFFDIEGDPTVDGGHEYLFGFINNDLNMFTSYWAEEYNQEIKAFEKTIKFLKDHYSKFPESHIYHYNHYETTTLKRLSIKYDIGSEILAELLRNNKFIDLYPIVRESMITSESGLSIKNLEVFYMNKRNTEVTSGSDSVDKFLEWKEFNEKNILTEIELYNKDDCISTKKLLEWLHSIKPEDIHYKEQKNKEKNEKQKEAENKTTENTKKYNKIKKELLLVNNEDLDIKQLIADMTFIYKREANVEWWLFFERLNKDYQELLEDMKSIAGLKKIKSFYDEKGYPILKLKHPEQDFKINIDDLVINLKVEGESKPKLYSADFKNNIIELKYSKTKMDIVTGEKFKIDLNYLPGEVDIGSDNNDNSGQLTDALSRFSLNFINKKKIYKNIISFLYKKKPKFEKDFHFLNESTDNALFKNILNLSNSYLFIQGPPGTGKTHKIANVIISLINKGKKIAITSNSHKAIDNVLEAIDRIAQTRKFSFKGMRISSGNKGKYTSTNITLQTRYKDFFSEGCSLLAATKYQMSKETYDQIFDYIFIDEAGQFSIADAIITSMSAKNTILVGDPNQLGQPSNIVHPGESGKSCISYILGDRVTIPSDQGVLLDTSYRMTPPINDFISSAFYDGKLKSHISTRERKLKFKKNSKNKFLPIEKGIILIETEHENNSQTSEEEIAIIKDIYDYLLKQTIFDFTGTFSSQIQEREITLNDILVVAPYNAQVNRISQALTEGNRTGTVDKFQGQQAPISILSMTSSDDENAPRGIDFLFDPKRLNVAISRAQCLSIVIMNKNLFRSDIKNMKQFNMINNFYKLRKYANK